MGWTLMGMTVDGGCVYFHLGRRPTMKTMNLYGHTSYITHYPINTRVDGE